MRLSLQLAGFEDTQVIPINYQYPLSAAIYKIISFADAEYASFLHDKGYGVDGSHKKFKLFTFSDLKVPFAPPVSDRLYLKSRDASLIVCFHIPTAAENFIRGLFINQQLQIADRASRATFTINQVEVLSSNVPAGETVSVILEPLSPLIIGKKNSTGNYAFRRPGDVDFCDCLIYNWASKFLVANPGLDVGMEELMSRLRVEVVYNSLPPQERRPIVKAGTPAQSKLRGYTKFRLAITAPRDMVELALNAGLGLYNAQGMGCVDIVNN